MNTWDLPLSWSWTQKPRPVLRTVRLGNGTIFVPAIDLPARTSATDAIATLRELSSEGVVIKGCDAALAASFTGPEGRLLLGHSAAIHFERYRAPPTVRRLACRVRDSVTIDELAIDGEHARQFAELEHASPIVEHLTRSDFEGAQRAFVARSSNTWLGAVTLTQYGVGRWHVERLARSSAAPAGTMELLLLSIIDQLKIEYAQTLNLGEVPWTALRTSELSFLSCVAPLLARLVERRFGLREQYEFKNAFRPEWEPRYFCGYPTLSMLDVFSLIGACSGRAS